MATRARRARDRCGSTGGRRSQARTRRCAPAGSSASHSRGSPGTRARPATRGLAARPTFAASRLPDRGSKLLRSRSVPRPASGVFLQCKKPVARIAPLPIHSSITELHVAKTSTQNDFAKRAFEPVTRLNAVIVGSAERVARFQYEVAGDLMQLAFDQL